ncbi:MAG: ACP S-malonyltransferase [bacterium]
MNPAKKAFIFPGHCVKVGMGFKDLPLPAATAELYKRADEILGCKISDIMQYGPIEQLRSTVNSQTATFLASIAAFYDTTGSGIFPDVLVGRSQGDFTAIVASGALPFEEGLGIIRQRGAIFERACNRNPGRMAVILGLPEKTVRLICADATVEKNGVCKIAGINTDFNIVISGTIDAVNDAVDKAGKNGASIMDIAVPGPFHTPLMKEAELEYAEIFNKVIFRPPGFPIIYDFLEKGIIDSCAGLKDFSVAQITRAVNWKRKTEIMRDMGVLIFCELGPSQGMARIASGKIPGSSFYEIEAHSDVVALESALTA